MEFVLLLSTGIAAQRRLFYRAREEKASTAYRKMAAAAEGNTHIIFFSFLLMSFVSFFINI